LIQTCKLNHIDPQRYLHHVHERIDEHPINRIEAAAAVESWNLALQLQQRKRLGNFTATPLRLLLSKLKLKLNSLQGSEREDELLTAT
jgi:hypothetical protein